MAIEFYLSKSEIFLLLIINMSIEPAKTRNELLNTYTGTDEEFKKAYQTVVKCFYDIMLVNLNTCLDGKNGRMAALVLSCCMIDIFAGFYNGNMNTKNTSDTTSRWNVFNKEYLKKYYDFKDKTNILYKELRCALIHNFTEGEYNDGKIRNRIELYGGNASEGYAFKNGDRYSIYTTTFVQDVVDAVSCYLHDVASRGDDFQLKFKSHFEAFGILEIKDASNSKSADPSRAVGSTDESPASLSGNVNF